jgi:hypothetical protein
MWPSGTRESFKGIKADHLVTVKEGSGIIAQERFGK